MAGAVFLDSSAVVKRYANEEGSEAVRAIVGPLLVAEIARVEVPAALWRKHRMGEMTAGDARLLSVAFAAEMSATGDGFAVVSSSGEVLGDAARLVARHPLRAYDAVQLATALAARRVGVAAEFASFDNRLNDAAAAEGLSVWSP